MAELPYRTKVSIDNGFFIDNYVRGDFHNVEGLEHFAKIVINCKDSDIIEVPTFMATSILSLRTIPEKIVFYIPSQRVSWNTYSRTPSSDIIFRNIMSEDIRYGLMTVSSPTLKYFGCRGMLADKNCNVLYLSTCKISVPQRQIISVKALINPIVFIDDSVAMHKHISRKVFPYLLTKPTEDIRIRINHARRSSYDPSCRKMIQPEVSVEDPNVYFERIKTPIEVNDVNKYLNNILRENASRIVKSAEAVAYT